jgi:hypothetical protein
MEINGGYFNVTVDPSLNNGKVDSSFAAAFPETTIILTVTPDERYALKAGSLKINDGTVSITGNGFIYTFAMPASDVTVSAEFEPLSPDTYSISVDSPSHGTINPDPVSAVEGTTVTLTVTPEEGYALKSGSLKYNDGSVDHAIDESGPTYTFTMPAANIIVSAEFEAIVYTISLPSPANGSVSANPASAVAGTTITLTVTPDTGYTLKEGSLKYNDRRDHVISGPSYSFTMPASDVTVSAVFERLYIITVGTFTGGNLSPNYRSVVAGTTITLTVTPDTGYVLKEGSLKYNDGSDHVIGGPPYRFTMPASDVTVSAFFNKVIDTITIEGPRDELIPVTWEKNPGNTLSDKKISWSNGDTITFTVAGYTSGVDLRWFMEGDEYSGTGDSITISAKEFLPRIYGLTVMIKVNGLWYSAETSIEIVR